MDKKLEAFINKYMLNINSEIGYACICRSMAQEKVSEMMHLSKPYLNKVVNSKSNIPIDNFLSFCYYTAYDPRVIFHSATDNEIRNSVQCFSKYKALSKKPQKQGTLEAVEMQRMERLQQKLEKEKNIDKRICLQISLKLFKLRIAAGLTCMDIAEELELSRGTIRAYEKGSILIPIRKLIWLCALYGLTLEELCEDIEGWEHYKDSPEYMNYMRRKAEELKNKNYLLNAQFINGQ